MGVAQDLQNLMNRKPSTKNELGNTRRARFELHQTLSKKVDWKKNLNTVNEYEYLDTLMEQVWGKDNKNTLLKDDLEGSRALHHQTKEELNVAKYSRFYQLGDADA